MYESTNINLAAITYVNCEAAAENRCRLFCWEVLQHEETERRRNQFPRGDNEQPPT